MPADGPDAARAARAPYALVLAVAAKRGFVVDSYRDVEREVKHLQTQRPKDILVPITWPRYKHEERRELPIHHQELGREALW